MAWKYGVLCCAVLVLSWCTAEAGQFEDDYPFWGAKSAVKSMKDLYPYSTQEMEDKFKTSFHDKFKSAELDYLSGMLSRIAMMTEFKYAKLGSGSETVMRSVNMKDVFGDSGVLIHQQVFESSGSATTRDKSLRIGNLQYQNGKAYIELQALLSNGINPTQAATKLTDYPSSRPLLLSSEDDTELVNLLLAGSRIARAHGTTDLLAFLDELAMKEPGDFKNSFMPPMDTTIGESENRIGIQWRVPLSTESPAVTLKVIDVIPGTHRTECSSLLDAEFCGGATIRLEMQYFNDPKILTNFVLGLNADLLEQKDATVFAKYSSSTAAASTIAALEDNHWLLAYVVPNADVVQANARSRRNLLETVHGLGRLMKCFTQTDAAKYAREDTTPSVEFPFKQETTYMNWGGVLTATDKDTRKTSSFLGTYATDSQGTIVTIDVSEQTGLHANALNPITDAVLYDIWRGDPTISLETKEFADPFTTTTEKFIPFPVTLPDITKEWSNVRGPLYELLGSVKLDFESDTKQDGTKYLRKMKIVIRTGVLKPDLATSLMWGVVYKSKGDSSYNVEESFWRNIDTTGVHDVRMQLLVWRWMLFIATASEPLMKTAYDWASFTKDFMSGSGIGKEPLTLSVAGATATFVTQTSGSVLDPSYLTTNQNPLLDTMVSKFGGTKELFSKEKLSNFWIDATKGINLATVSFQGTARGTFNVGPRVEDLKIQFSVEVAAGTAPTKIHLIHTNKRTWMASVKWSEAIKAQNQYIKAVGRVGILAGSSLYYSAHYTDDYIEWMDSLKAILLGAITTGDSPDFYIPMTVAGASEILAIPDIISTDTTPPAVETTGIKVSRAARTADGAYEMVFDYSTTQGFDGATPQNTMWLKEVLSGLPSKASVQLFLGVVLSLGAGDATFPPKDANHYWTSALSADDIGHLSDVVLTFNETSEDALFCGGKLTVDISDKTIRFMPTNDLKCSSFLGAAEIMRQLNPTGSAVPDIPYLREFKNVLKLQEALPSMISVSRVANTYGHVGLSTIYINAIANPATEGTSGFDVKSVGTLVTLTYRESIPVSIKEGSVQNSNNAPSNYDTDDLKKIKAKNQILKAAMQSDTMLMAYSFYRHVDESVQTKLDLMKSVFSEIPNLANLAANVNIVMEGDLVAIKIVSGIIEINFTAIGQKSQETYIQVGSMIVDHYVKVELTSSEKLSIMWNDEAKPGNTNPGSRSFHRLYEAVFMVQYQTGFSRECSDSVDPFEITRESWEERGNAPDNAESDVLYTLNPSGEIMGMSNPPQQATTTARAYMSALAGRIAFKNVFSKSPSQSYFITHPESLTKLIAAGPVAGLSGTYTGVVRKLGILTDNQLLQPNHDQLLKESAANPLNLMPHGTTAISFGSGKMVVAFTSNPKEAVSRNLCRVMFQFLEKDINIVDRYSTHDKQRQVFIELPVALWVLAGVALQFPATGSSVSGTSYMSLLSVGRDATPATAEARKVVFSSDKNLANVSVVTIGCSQDSEDVGANDIFKKEAGIVKKIKAPYFMLPDAGRISDELGAVLDKYVAHVCEHKDVIVFDSKDPINFSVEVDRTDPAVIQPVLAEDVGRGSVKIKVQEGQWIVHIEDAEYRSSVQIAASIAKLTKAVTSVQSILVIELLLYLSAGIMYNKGLHEGPKYMGHELLGAAYDPNIDTKSLKSKRGDLLVTPEVTLTVDEKGTKKGITQAKFVFSMLEVGTAITPGQIQPLAWRSTLASYGGLKTTETLSGALADLVANFYIGKDPFKLEDYVIPAKAVTSDLTSNYRIIGKVSLAKENDKAITLIISDNYRIDASGSLSDVAASNIQYNPFFTMALNKIFNSLMSSSPIPALANHKTVSTVKVEVMYTFLSSACTSTNNAHITVLMDPNNIDSSSFGKTNLLPVFGYTDYIVEFVRSEGYCSVGYNASATEEGLRVEVVKTNPFSSGVLGFESDIPRSLYLSAALALHAADASHTATGVHQGDTFTLGDGQPVTPAFSKGKLIYTMPVDKKAGFDSTRPSYLLFTAAAALGIVALL